MIFRLERLPEGEECGAELRRKHGKKLKKEESMGISTLILRSGIQIINSA